MIRLLALLLTVLTGFSGLVYEVTWQKYLATLLGSHSEATAAVLGLFLGGLAVGYSVFGALTRWLVARAQRAGRAPALLLVYGAVEASIGVFALAFPALFGAVQALSFLIPHGSAGLGFALDVLLCALLILPPAILMGGTIPILTQALARGLHDATRFHALVYAFNTAGAFAGALAAGYWLVPRLGLVGVLVAMGAINLGAGGVFLLLGWRRGAPVAEPEASVAAAPATPAAGGHPAGWASFAAVALLVGFAMMTLQTVLIRLGGLSFGSSAFTFSMVVAVFVLCIALGSFAVSALPRIPAALLPACLWGLLLLLGLLYLQADTAPYWAHALRSLFRDTPSGFYPYFLQAFFGVLLVIGLPVALSGAVLPLIFHALRERVANLGDVAGRLYSWNTLGSLVGALLGGYALLFWLDLHHTFRIAMAAIAVAAALATASSLDTGRVAPAVLLLTTLGAIALLPAWEPDRLSSGLFRNRRPYADTFRGPQAFFRSFPSGKLLFYDDDPVASIAVSESGGVKGPSSLSILSNGKSDSAIPGDNITTGLLALIPALFGPEPARAFVIGYGTGLTAGELAALGSTSEVIVAEIAPGVIEAAPLFDSRNLGASKHPKVRIVRGDAYRTLLRSEGKFDLIVSEPSNPWVTGIEMLYSREFLEAARDRLTPGGVHAQWFHSYESDTETIAMVLRTYASVFEHSALWFTIGSDLLLVGFRDPAASLDLARVAQRFARPDFRAGFERCKISSLTSLFAHELLPVGVLAAMPLPGPLHELLHPRLSYMAARAFFAGRFGDMPLTALPAVVAIGQRNSLLRRLAGRPGGGFDDDTYSRIAQEVCGYGTDTCLTWMARWMLDVPSSPTREQLEQRIRKNAKLTAFLRTEQVPDVMALYDDGPVDAEMVTPERATRASEQFRKFYHYAVPFSREALARLWRRCEADPEQQQRCYAARLKAERELGALGV